MCERRPGLHRFSQGPQDAARMPLAWTVGQPPLPEARNWRAGAADSHSGAPRPASGFQPPSGARLKQKTSKGTSGQQRSGQGGPCSSRGVFIQREGSPGTPRWRRFSGLERAAPTEAGPREGCPGRGWAPGTWRWSHFLLWLVHASSGLHDLLPEGRLPGCPSWMWVVRAENGDAAQLANVPAGGSAAAATPGSP